MRGLAGFLLLATGMGIAHFALLPTGLPNKPAAPQPLALASPAVGEWRSAREDLTVSSEPRIELPSQATVVVSAQVPSGSTEPRPKVAKPGDNVTRRELVRAIQRELARAGCYAGANTGVWRSDTKRAMGAFLAGVNASLPLDDPNYILLSLVRSDTRPICRNPPPAQSVVRAPQEAVSSRSILPGRMTVGGPVLGLANPVAGPVNEASNSSWSQSRQPRRDLVPTGLPLSPRPRSIREILTHPLASHD